MIGVLLLVLCLSWFLLPLREWIKALQSWLLALGPWGVLIFATVLIVITFLPAPDWPLAIAAIYVYFGIFGKGLGSGPTIFDWVLFGFGVLATVALAIIVVRKTKSKLDQTKVRLRNSVDGILTRNRMFAIESPG